MFTVSCREVKIFFRISSRATSSMWEMKLKWESKLIWLRVALAFRWDQFYFISFFVGRPSATINIFSSYQFILNHKFVSNEGWQVLNSTFNLLREGQKSYKRIFFACQMSNIKIINFTQA